MSLYKSWAVWLFKSSQEHIVIIKAPINHYEEEYGENIDPLISEKNELMNHDTERTDAIVTVA